MCFSFVSILPVTRGGKGHYLAATPHILAAVCWQDFDQECLEMRPVPLDPQAQRGRIEVSFCVCVCVCACPQQRGEHLRKLGRLAALVSVLILAHICHWSSSVHMFAEREAPNQLRTLTRLKLCVFTVMHCYLQCERYFIWQAMYGCVQ